MSNKLLLYHVTTEIVMSSVCCSFIITHNVCFFQFGLSCYARRYLINGSWNNAQAVCESIGSHLWTINSHEEWNGIFVKTAKNLRLFFSFDESEFQGFFDPLISTHFFIGLIRPNPRKLAELQVRA